MDLKKLIQEYLAGARLMQLATSANDQPWVCTIHFYSDEDLNIYWISLPDRRHSKEIAQNPKVAATMMIHDDKPNEKYIVGISVEGTATLASEEDIEKIGESYISKLGKDTSLVDDIKAGSNPHKFYKITPLKIVLLDTKNFPDNPRQEINL